MAFWGIELKPGKPFRQIPTEGTGSQLHITNAVLGLNPKQGERTVVKCKVGESPEIFLASLTGGSVEACVLDIIIADDVVFSVIGSTSVHLTGYYMPMEPQEMSDDEFDEYGEGEFDSDEDSEDYDEYEEEDEDDDNDEDEDEEDEEDEGVIMHGNKGVTIEEITDDAAAGALPVIRANPIVTETFEASESDEEDEDGFERHHKRQVHMIQVQEPPAKKQAVEEAPRAEAPLNENGGSKSTPKPSEKTKAAAKTPGAEKTPVSEEGGKKGKKKKGEKTPGTEITAGNGSEKKRKEEKTPGEKAVNGAEGVGTEKKKRKGENGAPVSEKKSVTSQEKKPVDTPALEEKRVDGGGKKKQADTPLEEGKSPKAGKGGKGTVREFPNGLKIEELGMGRPDGKRAEKGKRIFMQYVGKLAKNGKVFDASRGKPFAFRLGVGEVISGWDKGVEGMRVGDKRRLTIPPSMGYGARGAPPDIPGNATLVFDIELVNVK